MAEIVVAIPTFKRPRSLARLLDALAKLDTGARVTVVVADNDAQGHEGFDVCAVLEDYRWPLDAFVAPARGIANVRNALVARALTHACDFIAMLDDDEWPEQSWLDAFLATQAATGADALHGAVLRDYETRPGALAARLDGVAPMHGITGPVDEIPGTGNVLFTRACFAETKGLCFDPAFALCGGEDSDFFARLARRGCRFAWCEEAVVHAFVPASRGNLRWALARAYSVGNSDMRVFLKYPRTVGATLGEAAKIAGALVLMPLAVVAFGGVSGRAMDALRKLFRAAGKVAALTGRHYQEYAVTHGA
jgi:succinoglycan biosynthesis protein ExoM